MSIRALVIEDSIVYRKVMADLLREMPMIAGVTVAGTGREGLAAIGVGDVDVVFLDIHLPDMNGLQILKALAGKPAAPDVVVVSSAGGAATDLTVKALQHGALEFIRKPVSSGFAQSVGLLRNDLKRAWALVSSRWTARNVGRRTPDRPRPSGDAGPRARRGSFWVTVVASSTGGPDSLAKVIPALPADYPTPVVVVQHMPPVFTKSLAQNLDGKSRLRVVEAEEGMRVTAGTVYIAPGGCHMTVRREAGRDVVRLNDGPPECNVRPAADVLFRSLTEVRDASGVLALVMTGMGQDGKDGLRALKDARCVCLTQSRDTCVVYGMPRAVDEAGLSDESVALESIARRLTELHAKVPAGS